MNWRDNIISIDGPASAGKSTIAKEVARRLGFDYLDSGAIYRAVTYFLISNGVDIYNEDAVTENIRGVKIEAEKDHYFVNAGDVTEFLRREDVTENVPKVAKIKVVRQKLLLIQHKAAQKQSLVIDGRDIGSVVFPDAAFKFYLTATILERAKRRLRDIGSMSGATIEQIKSEIAQRDDEDKTRKISPLIEPADAIYIDTTQMSINAAVEKILYFYDYYFFIRRRKYTFYRFTDMIMKPVFKILYRMKLENRRVLDRLGEPLIIASNHQSNLDPLLLSFLSKRPLFFTAKKELIRGAFLRFLLKRLYTAIPIRRGTIDRDALNHLITVTKSGFSVVIFIEGTRTPDGQLGKARSGFGLIVKHLGLSVLPVRIFGAWKALPAGSFFPRASRIKIKAGSVIDYINFKTIPDEKQGYKEISNEVMDELCRL